MLPFSVYDKPTLKSNVEACGAVIGDYSSLDLSHNLANLRTHFSSRSMVIASHASDKTASRITSNFADEKKKPTVRFVFIGKGTHWVKMGQSS